MNPRKEHELHSKLVRAQIRAYQDEGTSVVAADLEAWVKPPVVGRHIPDIVAKKYGGTIYNESETCQTIGLDQTREQLRDFSRHGYLEVTVPQSCLVQAKEYAKRWAIEVERWWHYPGV